MTQNITFITYPTISQGESTSLRACKQRIINDCVISSPTPLELWKSFDIMTDTHRYIGVRPIIAITTAPPFVYKATTENITGVEMSWVCNECGSHEFTGALSEYDLDYLACSGCGCDEFHQEFK